MREKKNTTISKRQTTREITNTCSHTLFMFFFSFGAPKVVSLMFDVRIGKVMTFHVRAHVHLHVGRPERPQYLQFTCGLYCSNIHAKVSIEMCLALSRPAPQWQLPQLSWYSVETVPLCPKFDPHDLYHFHKMIII